ncbi:MAG: CaiB/BaiF CoA-transferase family protein [Beijerinckiaceae bacterium]|nr:CaiB/BaiF CoA-transferase family protein [Beijerinckiaceae bacterium]
MTPLVSPSCLAGLRVLDMSRVLAGPWAGQMLGDLGAEVIKIERPGTGDDTRGWGPPYLRDQDGAETSESAYFLCANRNKKSVTIDMTHTDGQKLLARLAQSSDILIENFKVGGLKKYGLDFEQLHKLNPRLIYCSITGFGQTGPYAPRAGYDFLVQAMGGLMSVTGQKDEAPQKVGVAITDILTGLHATVAILAALAHRHATGRGQHIDLSLLDTQIASLANQSSSYLVTGVAPSRLGNSHPSIVPYQDLPTSDGAMIVAVGNDAQFARLCECLGQPGWAADVRFATNRSRVENRALLEPLMKQETMRESTACWVALLEKAGVPCGPVNSIADVFDDPHVKARGARFEMEHPLAGHVPLVANPIRLSESPVDYRLPPPLLGQHTRDVLKDILGFEETDLDRLQQTGVISQG